MLRILKELISDVRLIIFPKHCFVCQRRLAPDENYLCAACTINLPLTNYQGKSGNPVERIFWGKVPIVRANAYYHYYPHNGYAKLVTKLKYDAFTKVGIQLGRMMVKDLKHTDFFNDINLIIPVPLSKRRFKQRGYNQSTCIAEGIKQLTGLPIEEHHILRTINNPTQTQLNHYERALNVHNIFSLKQPVSSTQQHPLTNKHVLLVDDVITTGATLMTCAECLAQVPNIKISILCVAIAGTHGSGPRIDD